MTYSRTDTLSKITTADSRNVIKYRRDRLRKALADVDMPSRQADKIMQAALDLEAWAFDLGYEEAVQDHE